ncbi:tRNA uridine-5-carboxymethylaminomethyl(34) synthesis GTPase MnmE [Buchnera aphidicola (Aphis nasturtii)]|uniref:tRNA uridine-5-carboxymethylaminomethyl(34) synthesis GTPase MnmE n=1 Tax=Buchnera aphidicola TaxID=9 RepID=UPI0010C4D5B4|nr:tRNA uridine-5-carboxymethylaminomethyl(34) synthesis GTPase MnmE [Buchnera aphidicola]QCI18017.1 tRNA uridine-5-carboxymethylaminomethyl(34) synthesis GTPase MnmE [Buchnera aphidicola (Aphis nasturtii)]
MIQNDTIVAPVTYPGKSAVGILRISGMNTRRIAREILGKIPKPRFATYAKFLNKNKTILDQGISLWFPAPFSFTGEDVLELQGHGNPLIMDLLIKRILSIKNTRLAKPGEFCERAFLNGKIDLVQAEAIDDLINSETESMVKGSLNSLEGNFSCYITNLVEILNTFRVNIESSIDFSEEEINFHCDDIVNNNFQKLNDQFLNIKKIIKNKSIIRESKKIIIIGPPNAGKSSLLNILSSRNRAIVTNIPGTTRDLLYESINIDGFLCEIIDTAGLHDTDNEIEKMGINRALEIVKTCDHILFVIDKTIDIASQKKISSDFIKKINLCNSGIRITFILNKNDLLKDSFGIKKIEDFYFISISALTGQGLDVLKKHLIKVEKNKEKEGLFIARRRHVHQIDLSYREFLKAKKTWVKYKNIELLAESLSLMNKLLGEIIGSFSSNDLLNRIFSTFCIGK